MQLATPISVYSSSPRLASTSRGFAVVWNEIGPNEDQTATLATIFDCCPIE